MLVVVAAGCSGVGIGGDKLVDFQTQMPSLYLLEESVRVRVTILNRGASAVEIPDPLANDATPEYTITDPHGRQATVTHAATRKKVPNVHDPEARPVLQKMTLAPQAAWSEWMPIDRMLELREPGRYKLQVTYTADGDRMQSPVMEFEIRRVNVTAFSLQPQGADWHTARLSTAWAHGAGSTISLVDAVRLGNSWGKDFGGSLYSSAVMRGAGGTVAQVALPATYRDRGMDFTNWIVWRQGERIQAQRTEGGQPSGGPELLYAGSAEKTAVVVDAPVMDGRHDLTAFLVEQTGGKAQLLRARLRWERGAVATVDQSLSLPAAPDAAEAVHFEEGGRDRTLVFLAFSSGGRLRITSLDGDSMKPSVVADVENARLLPGRPLAAYTHEGTTYVTAALSPVENGAVRMVALEVQPSGARQRGPTESALRVGEAGEPDEVCLVVGSDGPHLLWADRKGGFGYASNKTRAVAVLPAFRRAPLPTLLVSEGSIFVAGVRDSGAFGIEQLTPEKLRNLLPK